MHDARILIFQAKLKLFPLKLNIILTDFYKKLTLHMDIITDLLKKTAFRPDLPVAFKSTFFYNKLYSLSI